MILRGIDRRSALLPTLLVSFGFETSVASLWLQLKEGRCVAFELARAQLTSPTLPNSWWMMYPQMSWLILTTASLRHYPGCGLRWCWCFFPIWGCRVAITIGSRERRWFARVPLPGLLPSWGTRSIDICNETDVVFFASEIENLGASLRALVDGSYILDELVGILCQISNLEWHVWCCQGQASLCCRHSLWNLGNEDLFYQSVTQSTMMQSWRNWRTLYLASPLYIWVMLPFLGRLSCFPWVGVGAQPCTPQWSY